MPTYEYTCSRNQRTVEVQHGMKERLLTWGELCQQAGIDPGDTPPEAPVERVISGGLLATVSGGTPSSSSLQPLPIAGCCGNPASCRHHG